MRQFQEILVCVGIPEHAENLLEYAAAMTRFAESKRVHLLHVSDPSETPDRKFPQGFLEELAQKTLKDKVFGEVVHKILQGSPLIEILRYGHEQSVDLIVIGGGGLDTVDEAHLVKRIARKATCSVLILPEHAEPKLHNIVVPVRNTECSEQAVEAGIRIARSTKAKVICLNVFQVHSGVGRGNHTLEEYTEHQRGIAEKDCEDLLSRIDTSGAQVETLCVADPYGHSVQMILESVVKVQAELIVIGARGRSGLAGVLLADVTEKLIHQTPVPLLAVKRKGECVGILEALLAVTHQEA